MYMHMYICVYTQYSFRQRDIELFHTFITCGEMPKNKDTRMIYIYVMIEHILRTKNNAYKK